MNKYGCLCNRLDKSQRETLRNTPKQSKAREQTSIACFIQQTNSCANSSLDKGNPIMDARTIDNLELADPAAETRNLIAR